MCNKGIISKFAIDLCDANGFEECFAVLTRYTGEIGFDGVLYALIFHKLTPPDTMRPLFQVSDSYSPEFLKHYNEAGFAENDFVINGIKEGRLSAIDWWSEEQKGQLSQAEKDVIITAREDYNIQHGLTVPTLSTAEELSGVSVISSERNSIYCKLISENVETLQYIAKLFHQRAYSDYECKKIFLEAAIAHLNANEKNVLKFVETGLPLKSIESVYGIKQGYAKNILAELNSKFGAKNPKELRYLIGLYRIANMF